MEKNYTRQCDAGSEKNILDEAHFPDEKFRQYLLDTFHHLNRTEMNHVKRLDVSHLDISDLTGIQYFIALEELYCTGNRLSVLDLRENHALTRLDCDDNQIKNLSLKENPILVALSCEGNGMKSLDVSANAELQMLWCGENALAFFDLNPNATKQMIDAEDNVCKISIGTNGLVPITAFPDGFCFKKTSNWRNATRYRNAMNVTNPEQPVYYDYQVSATRKITFVLQCL